MIVEPLGPALMKMEWVNLLFAHWRVPVDVLRPFVPPGCTLDLFDGEAWLGVVPFLMSKTRPRFLLGIPGSTHFYELNVRTYVTDGHRPGVLFFSLDATSPLAVWGARTFFHLPYLNAQITAEEKRDEFEYRARRVDSRGPSATLDCRYGPAGDLLHAQPDTLEAWLTNRYFLYTTDGKGRATRAQVFHPQWPLQPAWAEFRELDMSRIIGLELPKVADHLLFSRRLAVTATRLYRLRLQ